MASKLKAVKPEVVTPRKPMFMVSGDAKVGKTWLSMELPSVYYIDTENGATRPEYQDKLIKAGGMYMGKNEGSQDFKTVINEIKTLATEEHNYKTLVIDSFSKLYNIARTEAEEKIGNEYSVDKKAANVPSKRLINALDRLDMNIVLIMQSTSTWKDGKPSETGFDGFEKFKFEIDLWLEVVFNAGKRMAVVRGSRFKEFVFGEAFPWVYVELEKRFGADVLGRKATPITLADPQIVKEVRRLLTVVQVPSDFEEKCLSKAGVDSWEELKKDELDKVHEYLKKTIEEGK